MITGAVFSHVSVWCRYILILFGCRVPHSLHAAFFFELCDGEVMIASGRTTVQSNASAHQWWPLPLLCEPLTIKLWMLARTSWMTSASSENAVAAAAESLFNIQRIVRTQLCGWIWGHRVVIVSRLCVLSVLSGIENRCA